MFKEMNKQGKTIIIVTHDKDVESIATKSIYYRKESWYLMSWPLIKNYWKKMYRSSSRMILTLFGLILAVVILMLGMIVCETFWKPNKSTLLHIEQVMEY